LGKTEGIFGHNAVLIGGLALPFVIMTAVSLKNAAALTISMLFSVLFGVGAGVLTRKIPVWLRYVTVTVAAMMGVTLSRLVVQHLNPEIFDSIGFYLPMMAVNSIVLVYAVERTRFSTPGRSFGSALACTAGFALTACVVGAVRELLLTGTLWGNKVFNITFPAANTVFFGFILLGFLGAAVQEVRRGITLINLRADNPTTEDLLRQQEERLVD